MEPIVYEIKKYRASVNTEDILVIPDAMSKIFSQLQSRFVDLMLEETDCMMMGSDFPEEKKREMVAIASFLSPGIDEEE